MTMQHGTQPTKKPRKSFSDDEAERKRGVTDTLPPRDGTTRTAGVSRRHRQEDRQKEKEEKENQEDLNLRP